MTINQFTINRAYPNYDIYGGVQKCVTSAETLTSELRKLIPISSEQLSTLPGEAIGSLNMSSLTSVPTVELLKMRSSLDENWVQKRTLFSTTSMKYSEEHLYEAIA